MALQRRSRTPAADRARQRGALAAVLAERRLELGLTQTELADLAGIARGPVVSAEAGKSVSQDVLTSLLGVLGLHLQVVRGTARSGITVHPELAAQYRLLENTDQNHHDEDPHV